MTTVTAMVGTAVPCGGSTEREKPLWGGGGREAFTIIGQTWL